MKNYITLAVLTACALDTIQAEVKDVGEIRNIAKQLVEQKRTASQITTNETYPETIRKTLLQPWTGYWSSVYDKVDIQMVFTKVNQISPTEMEIEGQLQEKHNPAIFKKIAGKAKFHPTQGQEVTLILESEPGSGVEILKDRKSNNPNPFRKDFLNKTIGLLHEDSLYQGEFALFLEPLQMINGTLYLMEGSFDATDNEAAFFTFMPANPYTGEAKVQGVANIQGGTFPPISKNPSIKEVMNYVHEHGMNPEVQRVLLGMEEDSGTISREIHRAVQANDKKRTALLMGELKDKYPASSHNLIWTMLTQKGLGNEEETAKLFNLLENYPISEERKVYIRDLFHN